MSPVLELQGAVVAALKSYAPLTAIVGARIYDEVPTSAAFPYVSLGPTNEVQVDADCIAASEITIQIDVWSRANGAPESLRIAHEVSLALADLSLTINALSSIEHRNTRRFRDPDGITNHAVVEMAAVVEQP